MTKRQTSRSRTLRRVAVVLAAAVGVSTVASTAGNAATSGSTPSRGGKINVGIFNQLPGWCVNDNPANSGLMVGRTVFETLFEKNKQGKLVGLLADKATASNGNKTWNITLRKGINFHDGTPFNADAVIANLAILTGLGPFNDKFVPAFTGALKEGKSQQAASIAGATALLTTSLHLVGTAASFTANIVGFSKVNDHEVKVDLHRAQADLPGTLFASGRSVMRSPSAFASKAACQKGYGDKGSYGTGPFMLKSWDQNKAVVVKNPNYWRKAKNGDKLPYLDQITFTYVVESAQRANGTKSGKFHASMFTSDSESTQIQELRKDKKFTEYKTPNEFYPTIFLNHKSTNSPFSNKNARLALSTCIDRDGYVKVRTRGEAAPAKSIVGPTSIMYSTKNFTTFNVKKAKEYVDAYKAETGKTSLEFTFPVTESSNTKKNAKFLIDQWKKCGLTPKQVDTTTANFLLDIFTVSQSTLTSSNKYDAVAITLLEGTDASFNLPFLLTNSYPSDKSSVGKSTHPAYALYSGLIGNILGLSYHSNTAVDTALFDAQAKGNKASYKKATELIQQEALIAPIVQFYYTMFTSSKLAGVGTTPLASKSIQRVMANYGIDWSGVYLKK